MKLIINVSNTIDVITNSSSEIFIISSDKEKSLIEELISELVKNTQDSSSGMGGDWRVETLSEYHNNTDPARLAVYLADALSSWDVNYKQINFSVEKAKEIMEKNTIFYINIDRGYSDIMDSIKSMFNVIKEYGD